MLHTLWMNVFYEPLYNALFFLVSIVPKADIGIAVIILTILVKIVLFPISKKSIVSQMALKKLEPELNQIKQQFPDKQIQAQKTMEVYKKNNVNPFSGCLLILLQLPVIFALYRVFMHGIDGTYDALYAFVQPPEALNTLFLGMIDVVGIHSIGIALAVAVTQFLQLYIATKDQVVPIKTTEKPNFQEDFARSMTTQMKYVLPVVLFFVSYKLSVALGLYFITTNIMTILQELYIRKTVFSKFSENKPDIIDVSVTPTKN